MHTATMIENEAVYLLRGSHEPNEETRAAILEGDELARIYCSRFADNEDTTTKG